MRKEIKIACLPVAGIENPYQYLMINGLNYGDNTAAVSGVNDRFLGILRTAILHKPNFIHFDWITSYYIRRRLWMTILNIPLFVFQILFVKYIFNIKIVWTLHNIQPHDTKYSKIHNFCRSFFARHTSWIRLFSEDSIDRAQNMLKVKCKFIICPEGSYVNYYENIISNEEARLKLNIKKDDFVYLYLGYIKPYKGIEELITSFQQLKILNKKLIIAGNALNIDYFNEIYTKDDNLLFENRFIENNELQNFYKSANVVVLPFKKIENSGSAILAMGFKKTVIAPRMGVLERRLINQSKFLFNKNKLTKKMELAFNLKDSLDTYGNLNFEELKSTQWMDFQKHFK